MGRFNELLGPGARYSRGANRVFGLQEQEGVTTVAPELMPVLELGSPPAEIRLFVGRKDWIGGLASTGGVGTRAHQQIFNPVDSGAIAVITRWLVTVGTTGAILGGIHDTALANRANTERFRDRRLNVAGEVPVTQLRESIVAAIAFTTSINLAALANTPIEIMDQGEEWVLPPGRGVAIRNDADSLLIRSTVWGYERSVDESELRL